MKITDKHPKKLNDPIIGNPAMHGKRWKIDYVYGPHTSYGKLSKRQVDEFAVNNMDTWVDTKHNDVDIGYNEFYEDLKPVNKLTGGVGDATAGNNIVGKIGNTLDGNVEGFSDENSIIKNKNLKQMNTDDFTVDLDIEEPALDEGKNSPTNKKLWSRALAAARSK